MANNENTSANTSFALRSRDPSPELRGKSCWTGFCCLGRRKRDKKIVPALRSQGASASSSRAWEQNGLSHSAPIQVMGLSPSLLAPPSSPASFSNSANASSAQSPASFALSLSVASANDCPSAERSFDSTAMMFTIGPYAHETALVTPPAFSALTTAPSTAPFTPPPELVQFTTPSSPDVPFAELLAASLQEKTTPQDASASYPASAMTSPDQATSADLVSCNPETTPAHRSHAITFLDEESLCFPTLKPDTSDIDAAYVASILLSQVSLTQSSPSWDSNSNEQQLMQKGRLSFGFENGFSSLLTDQHADIWCQKLHDQDFDLEDADVLPKSHSKLGKPIDLESNAVN